jgi:flagellar basal body-associated protein FliL
MINSKQNKINVNQSNKKLLIISIISILFLSLLVIFLISLNISKNKQIESQRQETKNVSQEFEQKIRNQGSSISSLEKQKSQNSLNYSSDSVEFKSSQKKSSSSSSYFSKNLKTEETEKIISENLKNLDINFGNATLTDNDLSI